MDRKDEIIQALQEVVQDLTSKLINLRVDAGLKLRAKDEEIESLKRKAKPSK